MTKYLVATGACLFPIEGLSPADAIARLKQRIDDRRHVTMPPSFGDELEDFAQRPAIMNEIGMSLVEAMSRGELNFVVMDEGRTQLLAGEYQGVYEEPATLFLARSLSRHIPTGLLGETDTNNQDFWE
ncbi:MAG: hypothetical protein ACREMY_06520 [bacterium]